MGRINVSYDRYQKLKRQHKVTSDYDTWRNRILTAWNLQQEQKRKRLISNLDRYVADDGYIYYKIGLEAEPRRATLSEFKAIREREGARAKVIGKRAYNDMLRDLQGTRTRYVNGQAIYYKKTVGQDNRISSKILNPEVLQQQKQQQTKTKANISKLKDTDIILYGKQRMRVMDYKLMQKQQKARAKQEQDRYYQAMYDFVLNNPNIKINYDKSDKRMAEVVNRAIQRNKEIRHNQILGIAPYKKKPIKDIEPMLIYTPNKYTGVLLPDIKNVYVVETPKQKYTPIVNPYYTKGYKQRLNFVMGWAKNASKRQERAENIYRKVPLIGMTETGRKLLALPSRFVTGTIEGVPLLGAMVVGAGETAIRDYRYNIKWANKKYKNILFKTTPKILAKTYSPVVKNNNKWQYNPEGTANLVFVGAMSYMAYKAGKARQSRMAFDLENAKKSKYTMYRYYKKIKVNNKEVYGKNQILKAYEKNQHTTISDYEREPIGSILLARKGKSTMLQITGKKGSYLQIYKKGWFGGGKYYTANLANTGNKIAINYYKYSERPFWFDSKSIGKYNVKSPLIRLKSESEPLRINKHQWLQKNNQMFEERTLLSVKKYKYEVKYPNGKKIMLDLTNSLNKKQLSKATATMRGYSKGLVLSNKEKGLFYPIETKGKYPELVFGKMKTPKDIINIRKLNGKVLTDKGFFENAFVMEKTTGSRVMREINSMYRDFETFKISKVPKPKLFFGKKAMQNTIFSDTESLSIGGKLTSFNPSVKFNPLIPMNYLMPATMPLSGVILGSIASTRIENNLFNFGRNKIKQQYKPIQKEMMIFKPKLMPQQKTKTLQRVMQEQTQILRQQQKTRQKQQTRQQQQQKTILLQKTMLSGLSGMETNPMNIEIPTMQTGKPMFPLLPLSWDNKNTKNISKKKKKGKKDIFGNVYKPSFIALEQGLFSKKIPKGYVSSAFDVRPINLKSRGFFRI